MRERIVVHIEHIYLKTDRVSQMVNTWAIHPTCWTIIANFPVANDHKSLTQHTILMITNHHHTATNITICQMFGVQHAHDVLMMVMIIVITSVCMHAVALSPYIHLYIYINIYETPTDCRRYSLRLSPSPPPSSARSSRA